MHYALNTEPAIEASLVGGLPVADVTVVIPTLNERHTIGTLIAELQDLFPRIGILVVDDNSPDGTAKIVGAAAKQFGDCVELLDRTSNARAGLTASVLEGLQKITTPYFVVMDGDLQHPPHHVAQLCAELGAGAQIVVATRLPYRESQGLHRVLMTRLSTWIAKRELRVRKVCVSDPMSGFFAGQTAVVRQIVSESGNRFERAGYKVLFDLLRIGGTGLKIAQAPYQFGLRPEGASKLRPVHAWYFLRSLVR